MNIEDIKIKEPLTKEENSDDKEKITDKKQDTKFKKGKSGNKNGRPKGSISLVSILKRKLEEFKYDKDGGKQRAEIFIDKLLEKAEKGEDKSIDSVLKYVEGLPTQKIDAEVKVQNYDWGKYKD